MSLGSPFKSLSATYIDGITAPINYIQNSGWEGLNLSNGGAGVWSAFSTTITNNYPTGTIGAASGSMSIGPTISNPLNASTSLLLSVTGALTAGSGFLSPAFFLNREDQASILTTQFSYEVASGAANLNFSGVLGSQTVGVFFYDLTNGAWVIPNGSLGMNQISGPAKCRGVTFQTPAAGFGNRYQLAIVLTQATAGAFSMKFDSFSCSPQTSAIGVPATDWTAYTPTITGFGTPTGVSFQSRRVGDSLEVAGIFTSGITTAVPGTFTLGFAGGNATVSISNAKLQNPSTTQNLVGIGATGTNTAQQYAVITPINPTNALAITSQSGGSAILSAGLANSYASSGQILSISATVPIQGWSSNVQMSSDTDTRVVDFSGTNSSTQAVTANVTNIAFTSAKDSHGVFTGTTYPVPVSGDYFVSLMAANNAASGAQFTVCVNGTQARILFESNSTGNLASGAQVLPNIKAGDIISFRCAQSITLNSNCNATIFKLSGPSVIAASETVSASYWVSANFASSTTVPINFDSKEYDDHGAVTTSATAWKFVAPIGGLYSVKGFFALTTNVAAEFFVYKNGVSYKAFAYISAGVNSGGSFDIRLVPGDYIDIRTNSASTLSGGTLNNTNINFVQILRVGN
jgi:hypothetical protein